MPKKRYVAVRMPLEAYNNFVNKQAKMEKVVTKITRRVVRIPLTKVFRISSETPINLQDEALIKITKKKRK